MLADLGRAAGASTLVTAIGDYAIIAFYYLLRVGEYATKGSRNETKQTVQFKLEDVVFFYFDALGKLRQLPSNATDAEILGACGATMKLDNQKNGWKGVCVFQETNGEDYNCPVYWR